MLYQSEYQHGGDIYTTPVFLDFSVNINPFGTPDSVVRAICDCAADVTHYPDPYCRELVSLIAQKEQVPERFVLCGSGAAELIYSWCLARKPRTAAETAPAFSEYSAALETNGCRIVRYPLREETDFLLDGGILDFLEKYTPEAVFLCNPNNPDGRNIPQDLLSAVLKWCRTAGACLFLDECFLDLSEQNISMKSYLEDYPELFILKAFTKNYAMAGVRLGYGLCSDEELLKRMALTVQPWNVSVPAQAAGAAALKETDFVPKARELISQERPWLSDALRKMGFRVCRSEANYLLFRGSAGLDLQLKERGIVIRNCSGYHNLGEGWYRISVRKHDENLYLIQILQELRKKSGIPEHK